MMNKNKKSFYDILDEYNAVASMTECTGLIQIPPTNIDEAEAYSEIYSVPEQITSYENKRGEKVIIEKQRIKK